MPGYTTPPFLIVSKWVTMMCGAECISAVKATLAEGRERGRKRCCQSNVPREVVSARSSEGWAGVARSDCEERGNPVSETQQHFHLQEEDGSKEMLRRALLLSASIKSAHGRDALKFMSLWLLCSSCFYLFISCLIPQRFGGKIHYMVFMQWPS